MYSPSVTQHEIERIESHTGLKLVRNEIGKCLEFAESYRKLVRSDGSLSRLLTRDEQSFILNEQILAKLDCNYFLPRYATLVRDGIAGGGLGKLSLWESQKLLMDVIEKAEQEEWEKSQRGEPSDGILICDHKARQIGHTAIGRAILMHRLLFWGHTRGTSASVDEDKVQELYDRDKLLWENLPLYLKPKLLFDVKNEHLRFDLTQSFLLYQQSNKVSSLGQGRQFNVAHCTELSEYLFPERVEVDFFPTLPQSWRTFCLLESRANGRGNWWHRFSELCRQGRKPRWRYCFIPWYAEPKKYLRTPPVNWKPSEVAMLHARHVHDTSREFVGKDVYLTREQLYWWESTRKEYQESGSLNYFLANYCCTPEESFQHSGISAFPTEFLEKSRLGAAASKGTFYEVRLGNS